MKLFDLGDSLECYVCTTQNGNTEKCLRTIRTCEPGEDYCLTTIAWGSKYPRYYVWFKQDSKLGFLLSYSNNICSSLSLGHPYWTINADKQYYVSKQCATKSFCEKTWNETLPYCERIWYLDWRCSECCQGDRCNYFVTVQLTSLGFVYMSTVIIYTYNSFFITVDRIFIEFQFKPHFYWCISNFCL
jgi:hypothetical protein